MPAAPRNTDVEIQRNGVHVLYGMSCSYFTGKLEAYFQAKGVPFRFEEMDRKQFQACAEATGIMQLPLFIRRKIILRRQRVVYLKQDGVTMETAPAIEALYMNSLRELDAIFAQRPFLFGDRPCEADFGLFGPFFRHFFCDPTAGALMRKHAPQLTHWVTRLWKTRPADLNGFPADRIYT